MLEKHRTSDLFRESSTGRSDYEIKWSLQLYSDSHDDLSSFQARAARDLESLSDLLSKISTEVESIGKAVDDLRSTATNST